jgi:hypothetical protein
MHNRVLAAVVLAFAFVALFQQQASAKTYNHGVTVFMSERTIGPDDVVDGDLNVIFGSVTCDGGTIHGEVRTIAGTFDDAGNCTIDGQTLHLLENSSVSSVAPWLEPGSAAILAENERVTRHLAYSVLVLLAFLLFPIRVRVALARVEHHPGASAAVGILALVAVVPIAVLLVLSIIGIPLVAIEIAALLAGLWIGQASVSLLIGRRVFELFTPRTTPSPIAALIVGLVVVSAAEMVPIIGWAVTATVLVIGLGSTILGFVGENALRPMSFPPPSTPLGSTPMKTG